MFVTKRLCIAHDIGKYIHVSDTLYVRNKCIPTSDGLHHIYMSPLYFENIIFADLKKNHNLK